MTIVYDKKEDKYIKTDEPQICEGDCRKCDTHILRESEVRYYQEIQKIKSLKK